jgi:NAD(P)-dependent dehydrogenase (short-subunit alcohol dehydrogenase family)
MRVAVVTGGASGIGEATARRFAKSGYKFLIADVQVERGNAISAALRAAGGKCEFYRVDLASDGEVADFATTVYAQRNRVDVVVNAGGVLQNAVKVANMAVAEFDRVWSINVRGTLLVNREFGPRMCAVGSGSIVNLCSLTSFRPSPQPAYAVGKAALRMMTQVMAAEFGASGVRVNAVAPGYTMTPAMKERIARGERDPEAVLAKSALRRFVEPSEVADTIYFLCSDEASAITGVTLPIDCGWLAYSAYVAYASQP